MSLVFSGIATHTPILLPTVCQKGLQQLDKTREAMDQLAIELASSRPEVVLIISSHGKTLADSLSINFDTKLISNFEEFGDLSTKQEWVPDTLLINQLREELKTQQLPIVLTSKKHLDYGTAIPLLFLSKQLPKIKIIPLGVPVEENIKFHFVMGQALRNEIEKSTTRVSVIASSDLSHRVAENSSHGLSTKGVAFDEKIQEILRTNNPINYLDIDSAWGKEADTCGINVLALLFGMLDGVNHSSKILSYEKPFGTGYLVAAIKMI